MGRGVEGGPGEVRLGGWGGAGEQMGRGADEPWWFGSRLSAQYETARTVHGLSDGELAELARGSVRGSRAPEPARRQILTDIETWLAS